MDLVTKFTNAEKKLQEYETNILSPDKFHQLRVLNIPYESRKEGPSEDLIQKRINALPEAIREQVTGYALEKEATKLVRTKIARLILFSEKQ